MWNQSNKEHQRGMITNWTQRERKREVVYGAGRSLEQCFIKTNNQVLWCCICVGHVHVSIICLYRALYRHCSLHSVWSCMCFILPCTIIVETGTTSTSCVYLDKLSCTCVYYDDMHDACHVFLLTESLSIIQLAAHLRLRVSALTCSVH